MKIGGMFPLEKTEGLKKNNYIEQNYSGDVKYLMSGRCALYYCLKDIPQNIKRTALLPSYTCETVIGSYIKDGWQLRFYDIDPQNLNPVLKQEDLEGISLISIAGNFGFYFRNAEFLEFCHQHGILSVQDSTFTPFAIEKRADYVGRSLRKWMGIASGGIACKKEGAFNQDVRKPDEIHLAGRRRAMEYRRLAIESEDKTFNERASVVFWDTEISFRNTFAEFGSDDYSVHTIAYFDFDGMKAKRKANYRTITDNLKKSVSFKPVFDLEMEEQDCPSHFCLYAENRDKLKPYLLKNGIASTTYWPIPPDVKPQLKDFPGSSYIFEHILSIQLDQRYGQKDMKYLTDVLNAFH